MRLLASAPILLGLVAGCSVDVHTLPASGRAPDSAGQAAAEANVLAEGRKASPLRDDLDDDDRSSPHAVSFLHASMSATAEGGNLRVLAALFYGVTTKVELDDGDFFTVRVGDQFVLMLRRPDEARYEATLHGDFASTEIVVAFHRAPGKPDAPLSTVGLGPSFQIVSAPQAIRNGDQVTLGLSPEHDTTTQVDVFGDCIDDRAVQDAPKAGDLTFRAAFATRSGVGCNGSLRVTRETYGKVDSAFQREIFEYIADFNADQKRVVPVRLDP